MYIPVCFKRKFEHTNNLGLLIVTIPLFWYFPIVLPVHSVID